MKGKFYYIVLLALGSISFFRPVFIDPLNGFYNYFFGLLLLIPVIPVIKNFIEQRNRGYFTLPVTLLLLSILISAVSARIFWDLGMNFAIFGSLFKGAGYFFYFYLVSKNIDIKVIEKTIIVIGLMFIAVFLTSFIIYPKLIVYYSDQSQPTSYVQRIFINGDGFLFLFYFLSLNKYKSSKGLLWIVFLLLSSLCIVLNQTRVYLASTFIITLFYLLQSTNFFLKVVLLIVCAVGFFFISETSFYETMQRRTKNDVQSGNNYIRVEAANYFLTDFQPSIFTRIFGNGTSYGEGNSYTEFVNTIQAKRLYYIEDIGFLGLYTYFGILAVIAYLIIFYKAFTAKLLSEHAYARMFIIFLLFTGLTTSATFNPGFIIPIVFAIYLFEKGRNPFAGFNIKMYNK